MSKIKFMIAAEEDSIDSVLDSSDVADNIFAADQDLYHSSILNAQANAAAQTAEIIEKIEATEDIAEKAQIATEHLYLLIGLKYGIESFDQLRFDKAYSVAQEGIFGRMGHSIKRAFTSMSRLENNIAMLKNKIPSGLQGGEIISDPGWGRVFNNSHKKVLDASDIMREFSHIVSTLESSDFKKILEITIKAIQDINKSFSKGNWLADDEAVKEIYETLDRVKSSAEKLDNIKPFKQKSYDPDFKTADSKQCEKLVEVALKSFNISIITSIEKYSTALSRLADDYNYFNNRLAGNFAADKRAIREVLKVLDYYMNIVGTYYIAFDKALYGIQEYVKQSIKRGV